MEMDTTDKHDYAFFDNLIDQGACFFLFRRPYGQLELAVFQHTDIECYTDIRQLNGKEGFIMVPFIPDSYHPVILLRSPTLMSGETVIFNYIATVYNTTEHFQPTTPPKKHKLDSTEDTYYAAFNKIITELHTGSCQKVVLSRALTLDKPLHFSAGKTFSAACEAYPEAFIYLCNNPVSGTWIGSSPELLLSGNDTNWQTVALAGTMSKKTSTIEKDWDDKNITEQKVVSVYIEEILNARNLAYMKSKAEPVKAGRLMHLKTDFCFQTKDHYPIGDLLEQLHPTPAVCGYPKNQALQLIINYEGYDRSYYSGFIGFLSEKGETVLYVNLRCMRIDDKNLTLFAGGGLLSVSDYKTECKETNAKLQTMLSLI